MSVYAIFIKVKKVIDSCLTPRQLDVAFEMMLLFKKQYLCVVLYDELIRAFNEKKSSFQTTK